MARSKGSTIGNNPLDAVVPMSRVVKPTKLETPETHVLPVKREKVTVALPRDLMERLRAAAYWTRKPLAGLVEEGVRGAIDREEKTHGEPFPPLTERLRPGRKIG